MHLNYSLSLIDCLLLFVCLFVYEGGLLTWLWLRFCAMLCIKERSFGFILAILAVVISLAVAVLVVIVEEIAQDCSFIHALGLGQYLGCSNKSPGIQQAPYGFEPSNNSHAESPCRAILNPQ